MRDTGERRSDRRRERDVTRRDFVGIILHEDEREEYLQIDDKIARARARDYAVQFIISRLIAWNNLSCPATRFAIGILFARMRDTEAESCSKFDRAKYNDRDCEGTLHRN